MALGSGRDVDGTRGNVVGSYTVVGRPSLTGKDGGGFVLPEKGIIVVRELDEHKRKEVVSPEIFCEVILPGVVVPTVVARERIARLLAAGKLVSSPLPGDKGRGAEPG